MAIRWPPSPRFWGDFLINYLLEQKQQRPGILNASATIQQFKRFKHANSNKEPPHIGASIVSRACDHINILLCIYCTVDVNIMMLHNMKYDVLCIISRTSRFII